MLLGKSSIHPAVHYTPLEEDEVYSLTYNPLSCTCGAIMNGYCPIDYASKTIRCCLCNTSERMPANYAQNIKPDNLPFELGTSEASYEFKSPAPKNVQYRTSYIFVVDLCVNEKELNSVKETLA